jgi:putative mRNA 3-end processing factor
LKNKPLIEFTEKGLFVHTADVYIDPWKGVNKAIITHAHSDHARWGSNHYACTNLSLPILKLRLGQINVTGYEYNQRFVINGVTFSFHPAGHIIGSAQVRVEYKGEIWVVSGDYKREDDGISTPFEVVRCHHFITESTFGLPVFNWQPQREIFNEVNEWWQKNSSENRPSVITAYALGKAQRVLANINHDIGPVYCHGSIMNVNQVLVRDNNQLKIGEAIFTHTDPKTFGKALIICTGSALNTPWMKRFKNPNIASLSGWMAIRGNRRRRGVDRGFVLSDHADWDGLNSTIKETGAENIYVTHGYTDIFSRWLNEQGYNAKIVKTEFGEETDEEILDEDSKKLT